MYVKHLKTVPGTQWAQLAIDSESRSRQSTKSSLNSLGQFSNKHLPPLGTTNVGRLS